MRLAQVTAGVLVAVAALTGCSAKEPANDTLPTPSATAAEATPTLPPLGPPDMPMPAEARARTPAGAETFLRYYIELYNQAEQTLDPSYMDSFSQGCDTCDRLIQNIKQDAAAGYSYTGGAVAVGEVSTPHLDGAIAETAFSMEQGPLTVQDGHGVAIPSLSAPAASLSCGAILTWSEPNSTWMLSQWDVS
jgi:hypothetical protein